MLNSPGVEFARCWIRPALNSAGVVVAEIEQVKGLEFDYVILVDVDAALYPDTSEARRRLHVGATRAIHQLWLTSIATPSPMVEGVWQG